jgi:hypothetical protein
MAKTFLQLVFRIGAIVVGLVVVIGVILAVRGVGTGQMNAHPVADRPWWRLIPLHVAHAGTTNISATTTDHWAWDDAIGWIDFYNTQSIIVSSQQLTGYASSSIGDFSLDCATARGGSVCSSSTYKVANDGNGVLSGWGWNDAVGWVSFNYGVYITSGEFHGYAWNDAIGWISFNCAELGTCSGSSTYRVVTSWVPTSTSGYLDSATYDTGVAAGAQINSVLWHGGLPSGTQVGFQFAASNASSGPWTVFTGPSGTSADYYPFAPPDTPTSINPTYYNNQRYFRYRVTLFSDIAQRFTPRIDDVIINWSP